MSVPVRPGWGYNGRSVEDQDFGEVRASRLPGLSGSKNMRITSALSANHLQVWIGYSWGCENRDGVCSRVTTDINLEIQSGCANVYTPDSAIEFVATINVMHA